MDRRVADRDEAAHAAGAPSSTKRRRMLRRPSMPNTPVIGSATAGSTQPAIGGSSRAVASKRALAQQRAQRRVGRVGGEGDREDARVAVEDRVLEIAEVGADRGLACGRHDARQQPVEARAVEDPARRLLLLGPRHADGLEPAREARAAAARVDEEIGARSSRRRARCRTGARRRAARRAPPLARVERDAAHVTAVAELEPRRIERDAVQHPLEGEPAAGEQREVVVARARRAVVDLLAQRVRERELLRAHREQRREHVGQRGRATGCGAAPGGRASAAPAARRGAPSSRRPSPGRAGRACRRARAP